MEEDIRKYCIQIGILCKCIPDHTRLGLRRTLALMPPDRRLLMLGAALEGVFAFSDTWVKKPEQQIA